ncbi:Gp37 family protein [Flexibacterium corallicola]|uniref:Gp37 family protein n=1 Tax=Flexibacterium corallicola TaxID=3037259 RepID=UPI00286F39E3|nr:Gp37 family protein [Pseudovibrio sp. M1P-2-3]
MTLIAKIEAALIERLKRQLTSAFYVASFPADPRQFDSARMKAAALVHFSGSRYRDGVELDGSSQLRELRYTIVLYLHDLHGGAGAYPILEKVRHALMNVSVEGATPIKMLSEQLTDAEKGQWEWQVDIACTVRSVAAHHRLERPRRPLNKFTEKE